MTATWRFTASRPDPRLPRDPELAQRRERDAPVEHLEAVGADLAQERAVDRRHDEARALVAAVLGRELRLGLRVISIGALGLELHEAAEAVARAPREDVLGAHA